ncbi:S-layer homology domain-containing protein [Butyricicoccus sp. 1XD8-22]|nr:S-layer homology domain-containing protein [Butyricicoccus sp. 1XD8-22]
MKRWIAALAGAGLLLAAVQPCAWAVAAGPDVPSVAQIENGLAEGPEEEAGGVWAGDGTAEHPYEIADADGLLALQAQVAQGERFAGCSFQLTGDLVLPDTFSGIGSMKGTEIISFDGVFDGDGHTVTLCASIGTVTAPYFYGLFNVLQSEDAVIRNVNVVSDDIVLLPQMALGGVVGRMLAGRVENCTFEGSIKGLSNVGGIVGYAGGAAAAEIVGCSVKEGSKITNVPSTVIGGNTVVGNHIGGVLGYAFANVTVTDCDNYADVSTAASTGSGGIVGRCFDGSVIRDCTNYGAVLSGGAAGGIAGNLTAHHSADGSLYGNLQQTAVVERCVNAGSVSSGSGNAGAIAGTVETGGRLGDGCENENAAVASLVGGYAIQLELYEKGVRTGKYEAALYQDGGKVCDLTLCDRLTGEDNKPSSTTYGVPFYRYVRGAMPQLFRPIAPGSYELYLDGQDSGYRLDAAQVSFRIELSPDEPSPEPEPEPFPEPEPKPPSTGNRPHREPSGSSGNSGGASTENAAGAVISSSAPSVADIAMAVARSEGNITVKAPGQASLYQACIQTLSTHGRGLVIRFPKGEIVLSREVCAELADALETNEGITASIQDGAALVLAGSNTLTLPLENGKAVLAEGVFGQRENASAAELPFSDVAPGDWCWDAVQSVYSAGLMQGLGDGKFAPEAPVTRAMLAAILWRHAGEPQPQTDNAFSDVPKREWYTDAIRWLIGKGVVSGFPDQTFRPGLPVTREQAAVILYHYLGREKLPAAGELSGFTDAEMVSDYAEEAVRWAVRNGILQGTGSGALAPQAELTRAQAAALLARLLIE